MSAAGTAEEIIQLALDTSRQAGAAQTDAVLVESESLESRVRGDEIDFVVQARERSLGIRSLMGHPNHEGHSSAVTSTSDLSSSAVRELAEQTVALARETAPDTHAGLPDQGFARDIPDLELSEDGDRNVALEARIEDARRAEQAARQTDPRIDNSEGTEVRSDFSRITYGNSLSFLSGYDSASHSIFSQPVARENGQMQRDYWVTVGRRLDDLEDAAQVGKRAAARAVDRLGARRVATCEVPVIFDSFTASSLLGQLMACVSGYAVYRDASFLGGRMGEMVAPENIQVIDDGRRLRGLGSKPFDGEGLATQRTAVIENGRLSSWLLDSYSGRKLGLPSTGNATRGAGSAPSAGATNLWLEPGEASLEEMVANTPRGLLVTELIGMGFNPVTGDYSRGAAGHWIESGEIAYPVEEITIAGQFGEMLQTIDCVGSELEWRSRIAAPPLRISKMTVAGE